MDSGRGLGLKSKAPAATASVKTHFRGYDVPGQIQRAFGNGVGAVVAFVQRDGLDDALGDAVFVFESGEIDGLE